MHTKTFCRIRQQEEPSEENDMNSKEFLRLVTNIFTRSVFFFLLLTNVTSMRISIPYVGVSLMTPLLNREPRLQGLRFERF